MLRTLAMFILIALVVSPAAKASNFIPLRVSYERIENGGSSSGDMSAVVSTILFDSSNEVQIQDFVSSLPATQQQLFDVALTSATNINNNPQIQSALVQLDSSIPNECVQNDLLQRRKSGECQPAPASCLSLDPETVDAENGRLILVFVVNPAIGSQRVYLELRYPGYSITPYGFPVMTQYTVSELPIDVNSYSTILGSAKNSTEGNLGYCQWLSQKVGNN